MKKINIFYSELNPFEVDCIKYKFFAFNKLIKTISFTNIGRKEHKHLFPELETLFSKEDIKNSYLIEQRIPNFFLKDKYTNNLGKKYIIVFTDKKYIKKFEKYGFKIIKELDNSYKYFYGICMRKEI